MQKRAMVMVGVSLESNQLFHWKARFIWALVGEIDKVDFNHF